MIDVPVMKQPRIRSRCRTCPIAKFMGDTVLIHSLVIDHAIHTEKGAGHLVAACCLIQRESKERPLGMELYWLAASGGSRAGPKAHLEVTEMHRGKKIVSDFEPNAKFDAVTVPGDDSHALGTAARRNARGTHEGCLPEGSAPMLGRSVTTASSSYFLSPSIVEVVQGFGVAHWYTCVYIYFWHVLTILPASLLWYDKLLHSASCTGSLRKR